MVIRETTDADYGVHGGGSDATMGRLITWVCAHAECNDGGDAWGCRRSCKKSCRGSMYVKRSGFHLTGP